MSWSISIPKTPRDDFAAAVAKLEAPLQDGKPIDSKDFSLLTETLNHLAGKTTLPFINASAGGHDLREGEGANFHNGVSISVGQSE